MTVSLHDTYADVTTKNHKLRLYFEWLRDHCRCPTCYSAKTHQRLVDPLIIDEPGAIEPLKVVTDQHGSLHIDWKDGHKSIYTSDFLIDYAPRHRGEERKAKGLYAQIAKKASVWTMDSIGGKPPAVPYEEYMTDVGLKKLYENVARYGFCTVTGCAATRDGTKEVIRRMGVMMESAYGHFWDVTNLDREYRPDMISPGAFAKFVLPTGSSQLPLITHNDNAHYEHPAGFRAYQIIEHTDGDGGESWIVDGFSVMKALRGADPKAFKLLCTVPIPFEKIMDGRHIYNEQTICTVDPDDGTFIRMRYKDPYRGQLSNLAAEQVTDFYNAYMLLTKLIRSPEYELRYLLPQGTVIVYDNWRCLHGRGAFTGKRIVHSGLLQRDEFWSHARVAGALE